MTRTARLLILILAGAAMASGQAPPREPMRGVKRGDKAPVLPMLVVGVNAAIGTITEPGWPLVVSVAPSSDDPAAPPPLPADLAVRITKMDGGPVALTFETLTPPAAPGAAPGLYWVAAESATAQLAPGRYRVTVVAPAGVPPGWKVEAGEIRVLAPAPERQGRLSRLRIHQLLLRGRDDEALAEADRATGADPRDAQAWVAKAEVLMRKDDPDAALAAYDRALNLHRGDKLQPYPILRLRQAAQRRALEKRGVIAPP